MNDLPKCRLLELRKKHNLTQDQLANAVKISATTVSNIESAKNLMSIDIALIIAKEYKVSLDWLYGLSDDASPYVLDSFSSFFDIGQAYIPVENKTVSSEFPFLTVHLSSSVRDYLLEKNDIEKINKERDLPEPAYKAWLESIRTKYLKELQENGEGETVEYVLIENDENWGSDVAYARARRQLPDLAARIALDKMNFDNE